ncbi:MAG: glycoside hydrolase family protein [Verrucomicrobiota bacterium]|jgi:hypothetical protein
MKPLSFASAHVLRRDFLRLSAAACTGLTARLYAATASASTGLGDDLDLSRWLQPVPASAIFEDPAYCIWCGSVVRGDDGRFHLFYSRWPRKLGHKAWVTHSEVARAMADSPTGPFKHAAVVLPARGEKFWDGSCTHNPTILRVGKKYCLYYMGNYGDGVVQQPLNWIHRNHQRIGVALADSPAGPWTRFDRPVVDVSADKEAPDALMTSNPATCVRPDGGVLMVYKAVATKGKAPFGGPVVHLVATAAQPEGPFQKSLTPIFTRPGEHFAAEDPFLWHDGGRYRAVVKDNNGIFTGRGYSLALWESRDGFDWKLAKHPFVTTPEITRADGTTLKLNALERPQLWIDARGEPAVLYCAGAYEADRERSFNVAIPLRRPR